MTPMFRFTLLSLLCATQFVAAHAQTQTLLTPSSQRTSDQAIYSDNASYTELQERIQRLNERGVQLRDYHLSKAQCWLDVSLHEYTQNDRSSFPQDAMTESEKIIVDLEKKTAPASSETPLVNGAARVRPDLWERIGSLKQHAGFKCAWKQVACAEVELVHSGNELNQQGWRHAKPYVQIAEDFVAEANGLVDQCLPTPVPKALVVPIAAPLKVAYTTSILFDFDKYTADHIRVDTRTQLDSLIASVKKDGVRIEALSITGYADRLNGTGNKVYNQELSQKRVDTVRDLLVAQGLPASSMSIDAKGDSAQVVACKDQFKTPADLKACLLPNRRVQVDVKVLKDASLP